MPTARTQSSRGLRHYRLQAFFNPRSFDWLPTSQSHFIARTIILAIFGCGASLILLSQVTATEGESFKTTKELVASCERAASIYDQDGMYSDVWRRLSEARKDAYRADESRCSDWIGTTTQKYCEETARADQFELRDAVLDAARDTTLSKLPLEKFAQNFVRRLPGCGLQTCPSNRVTYRSEDGQRKFVVTDTARGLRVSSHAGGKLTQEMTVHKGQIGDRTFYVHDVVTISNTGNMGVGTKAPTWGTERLDAGSFKLIWRSWTEQFRVGRLPSFEAVSADGLPISGGWFIAECRGGARCPVGWAGKCDVPG